MDMINEKPISKIQEEKKEQTDLKLADIYEILLGVDDRLTKIEKSLGGK